MPAKANGSYYDEEVEQKGNWDVVTIEQIKNICDKLDGNCGACPFALTHGCPFLSDDPMDWDVDYANKRFVNSQFNKVENSDSPASPVQHLKAAIDLDTVEKVPQKPCKKRIGCGELYDPKRCDNRDEEYKCPRLLMD